MSGDRARGQATDARRPSGERGSSAIEVMLALIVLSTAILGAAAAQASSWRVLAGTRVDSSAWAAMHAQAEELTAQGYHRVKSGSRVVSGHPVQWVVSSTNPKVVLIVAQHRVSGEVLADTVRLVLREPSP